MSTASPDTSSQEVSLRPVTTGNLRAICRLDVAENQRHTVAPNARSIAEAYFHREEAWFRAIYAGEEPVGFLMLYDSPVQGFYGLWRLMIDRRFQGRGYGRRAVELLIDYVRTRPKAKELIVSYHKGPGGPEGFYRKLGFVETGERADEEYVAKLVLGRDGEALLLAADDRASRSQARVDPDAIGAAFITYCTRQGWLVHEGAGNKAVFYATPQGREALRGFGIDS